jgi:hypothetical protein
MRNAFRVGKLALAILLPLGMLVAGAGCGGADLPPRVPVSGTVNYQGKPVPNVQVSFVPVDNQKSRPGQGTTDASGKFVIATFEAGDGVMPGEYKITVSALDASGGNEKKEKAAKSPIPIKYAKAETSGLVEKISAAKDVPLDLKD